MTTQIGQNHKKIKRCNTSNRKMWMKSFNKEFSLFGCDLNVMFLVTNGNDTQNARKMLNHDEMK